MGVSELYRTGLTHNDIERVDKQEQVVFSKAEPAKPCFWLVEQAADKPQLLQLAGVRSRNALPRDIPAWAWHCRGAAP